MTIKLDLADKTSHKQLGSVVDSIAKAKRVVFVSGAGISCSAGIPDFRSMNGLYSKGTGSGKLKGKDLFDVSLFNNADSTSTFYSFMNDLRIAILEAQPTPTHKFLKTLKDRGSLLRSYTQNIDGLESHVGLNLATTPLKANDVMQLHGDIHTLKCYLCSEVFSYNESNASTLSSGNAPSCPSCADKCAIRVACGRRPVTVGTLRPNIVLYGENHPSGDAISDACSADLKRSPDCLIIAGTSLKVPGFKTLIKNFAASVHARNGLVIFLNLTQVSTSEWAKVIDFHVQGTSDDFIQHMKETRPSFFTKQTTLDTLHRIKPATLSLRKSKSPLKSLEAPESCTPSSHSNAQSPIQLFPTSLLKSHDSSRALHGPHVSENKENIRPRKRRQSISRSDIDYDRPRTRVRIESVARFAISRREVTA